MAAIKKNLSMMDNQLLLIYNQVNDQNAINPEVRKVQIQSMVSKIINDIFVTKMKNSIGFTVDFKKSCDAIMEYIFRTNDVENTEEYNVVLLKTLSRLNDISKNKIDFHNKVSFERNIHLDDEFSKIIGNTILDLINEDFQWNTFFKVFFEIELGNNAEDFESYIQFLKNMYYEDEVFIKLSKVFKENEVEEIKNDLLIKVAYSFSQIQSIKFIYRNNVDKINDIIKSTIKIICNNIKDYDEWERFKHIYLEFLYIKIVLIFDSKVEASKIKEFIEEIDYFPGESEMKSVALEYINKFDELNKANIKELIKLLKI